MNDISYQVVRPFQGLSVGAVLSGDGFKDSRRALQLVEQRFIQPITSQANGYQPSVATLLATPIRQLRFVIADVQDTALLEVAKQQETREIAMQLFQKRIEELNEEAVHA